MNSETVPNISPGPMKRMMTWAPSLPDCEMRTPPSITAWARTPLSPWLKMRRSFGRRRTRAQAATPVARADDGSPRKGSMVAVACRASRTGAIMEAA